MKDNSKMTLSEDALENVAGGKANSELDRAKQRLEQMSPEALKKPEELTEEARKQMERQTMGR